MQETKAMGEVDEMFMRLAISGKARRGKDTLRTPLIEEHGIVPVSFADPMREVMRHVTGLSAEELEAIKTKRTTPEIRAKLPPSLRALSDEELGDRYRNTMQFLGTECYRVQWAPDTWTFEFEKRLANAVDAGAPGVVLADLRFENEFTYLKEKGFAMVRISGPDFSDALTGEKAKHESEVGLDAFAQTGKFDVYVWNDRTVPPYVLADEVPARRQERAESRPMASRRAAALRG